MANKPSGSHAGRTHIPGARKEPSVEIVIVPQQRLPTSDPSQASGQCLKQYVPLYQAALKGDWNTAAAEIAKSELLKCAPITKGCETALHIAAAARHVHFVEELVKLLKPDELAIRNNNKNTALCFAATAGTVKIAELMVEQNKDLPMERGSGHMTPLLMAALLGHNEMVQYLYKATPDEQLTPADRIELLVTCITTGLYGVARKLLEKHPNLAVARAKSTETALHVLARKPKAFVSDSHVGIWKGFISSIPGTKAACNKSVIRNEAIQLLTDLWKYAVDELNDPGISDLIGRPTRILFDAAESGNIVFLKELIHSYPDLIWKVNENNQSIFHIAVMNRHESIFSLIYEIGSIKDLIASRKEEKTLNTMLHLAAKIAPPSRLMVVSGAALQMQRELLWFNEVEKVVTPLYGEMKNSNGLTPRALFSKEHKDLVKAGEDWMKNTANSCMVVAALIATVAFAAAFTVPGGLNNDTGTPLFLRKASFMVFIISDVITLFSSSTSILMFLSILTSRYAENDFLVLLPLRLILGLGALFISITTMMIAFSTTFFVMYHHNWTWIPIPIAFFASVPVTLYASLQYRLLADVVRTTYSSRFLFHPKKRLIF